ncbi:A disintegrin and metalloproteinase with thrombospondin motifs 17 isoform X2 [Homo sapiens]|uniref:A disintegrin and metalloproteinase with thrombospondin motifs 17 isoform X2 n=1 Tax=Homo sapiens TaxID=9606 RepID=UPI0007DC4DD5|nr:A disintegrin and metalloproteinase with thrombospondin motifs 17 isoform X2 [Homo sapiens]|eukprot:XP_016877463.1 A disintegrin and metalloproteinase with thrombospondin motifs 17 isoform X2 [Homo sapiens]
MCDGALLPPLVLPVLLLLVWGLDPGTAVGDAAADVEVVLPWRVRPDDVHLPPLPAAPGPRRRRRPRTPPAAPRARPGERALLLHLPAFGRDLYLQLRRDLRFLSRGFEVEEAGAARRRGRPAELCFYSGRVLGHPGSLVSLSACGAAGGLVGLIQLGQEQVLIQPLNNSQGPFSGREHLIRRKWSLTPSPSAEAQRPEQLCKVLTEKKKPTWGRPSRDWRERRNAIRLTSEHTVETLVVADADMVQYHGAEAAQRFILTVMNMVYNMFQHQSLGIKINIQVTKLVLLRQRPAKLSIGHHGERSLESFCHWQNEEYGGARYLGNNQVPGGKDDPPLVDAAVFVTRTDFCVHKDEPCDTVVPPAPFDVREGPGSPPWWCLGRELPEANGSQRVIPDHSISKTWEGIAYLGGVCSAKRKCVLAEDNGLNLAFTIAHELGHNLGMNHDDDHSSCAGRSHIMSGEWVKGRNPSDLSWSSCSRDDLENFLKSKVSTCLLVTDPRSQHTVRLPHKLPGMHYSANEQCQILFGMNATFCRNMEHLMCAGLWCLVEGDTSCKTKLDPPLDGTECGADKWCRAGECVSKTPIPEHVDGDWSPWGAWSMCSRTCGTGARFRQRKCDNPPPGPGGTHCPGASVEHAVCENLPCPKGLPSFRDQQCQAHDRLSPKKKGLLTAVVVDDKPCELYCSPLGKESPLLVADRVLDGTPCGPYETDLCVHGKCQKIGCDGIIGSAAKEDRCGVCSGDGKTCHLVKGDFSHARGTVKNDLCTKVSTCVMAEAVPKCFSCYIEAAVIPAGARRIRVVEDKPAHSFLALKDSGKGSINSDWKIELPGEFQIAGTTVRYVRRGLWEKISAKGPTKLPLHLMVLLFHDQDYGIHYEYTVPVNRTAENQSEPEKPQDSLFIWTHSGWEGCSVQCGGGERRTIVSCTRIVNKTTTLVNDSDCPQASRPEPQVRRCNLHPCQSRWVAGPWSPCSATCEKGFQHREVTCVYQLQNGTHVATRPLYCPGPRPAAVQSCEGQDCLSIWEASEWSQCSASCGKGVWKRTVACTNSQGKCDASTRPRAEEACEDYSGCYEWKTGDWSTAAPALPLGAHWENPTASRACRRNPKRSPRQDAGALDARLAMLCGVLAGPSLLPWGHLGQTSLPFTPGTPGQGPGDAGTDRAGGHGVVAGRSITEPPGQHSREQG